MGSGVVPGHAADTNSRGQGVNFQQPKSFVSMAPTDGIALFIARSAGYYDVNGDKVCSSTPF